MLIQTPTYLVAASREMAGGCLIGIHHKLARGLVETIYSNTNMS